MDDLEFQERYGVTKQRFAEHLAGMDSHEREKWIQENLEQLTEGQTYTVGDVLFGAFKEPEFLIDQYLRTQGVAMLVGEPGGGKSWLAYDLIRSVSTGQPWLGRMVPTRSGPTILFDYESGIGEIKRRLRKLGFNGTEPVRIYPGQVFEQTLFLPEATEGVGGIIDHVKPRLVVFDSFRACLNDVDENDSKEIAKAMHVFKHLARRLDCLVLLLHHVPKGVGKNGGVPLLGAVRGSGEIAGALDTVIEVSKINEKGRHAYYMTLAKARGWDYEPGKSVRISIQDPSDDEVVVKAHGHLPGVPTEEVDLAKVVEIIEAEGPRDMGHEEVRESSGGMSRTALAKAIELGVARGILGTKRESRDSQKQVVWLIKK